MTEEEAKTKWCPEAHRRTTVVVHKDQLLNKQEMEEAVNRDNCIASDCMMWRWSNHRDDCKIGYCGKGGKP